MGGQQKMLNRPATTTAVRRQKQTMIYRYMMLSCISLALSITLSANPACAFSTSHSILSLRSMKMNGNKGNGNSNDRSRCSEATVSSSTSASMPLFLSQNNNNNSNDPNEKDNKTMDEKIDKILDTPFFDPDKILDNDANNGGDGSSSSNPLTWFANLVKNDYETAEALYAGVFFSVMVVLGQELLRMYMYGDGYIPFQGGKLPGSLF
mmetsp:Transcript_16329/g.24531  ORF Transcript_16329/g.24531 Transcript_16329/m.24531 type:complete len:208 (-) Transcript_16329:1691-2314(-)